MKENFEKALSAVLTHEGGYVNHPRDPGGATNKGVTQKVYNNWRTKQGLVARSVKFIETPEISAIYKREYWDRIKGDGLPSGVDYCVFDFAVNSGVIRASKYLQEVIGVDADGVIGAMTLAAVKTVSATQVIDDICDNRLAFLKRLETFDTFGRGWTQRVKGVRSTSKALVQC